MKKISFLKKLREEGKLELVESSEEISRSKEETVEERFLVSLILPCYDRSSYIRPTQKICGRSR